MHSMDVAVLRFRAGHRPKSMSQMKKNVAMHVTCVQVCDGDIPIVTCD